MIKQKGNYTNNPKYTKGPSSDIPLTPHHGGPILNMDIRDDIIVTASTDHGARMYNLVSGKQIRELYTKQYGHTEWVTCVKILSDGRILTGGMDSKICLWQAKVSKCIDLTEHEGSISKIMTDMTDPNETLFLSSSYDSTIRVYLSDSGQNVGVLKGAHKKPVTEFIFTNSIVASADRDGNLVIWDMNRQSPIFNKPLHQGQISNIIFHSDDANTNLILTSGINDGVINGIDMRTSERAFSKRVHSGAINFFKSSPMSNLLFSGSADKTIKIFDLSKSGLNEIVTLKSTDAVFCGDVNQSSFLCVGSGDGNLLGYDLNKMECLWGYGVEEQGAVRCCQMYNQRGRIITGGDSGRGLEVLFE